MSIEIPKRPAGCVLDLVLEQIMKAVHRFERTVNQVMGDGIMATGIPAQLFGQKPFATDKESNRDVAPAHQDFVHQAVFNRLFGSEEVVAIGITLDGLHVLPRVFGHNLVEPLA